MIFFTFDFSFYLFTLNFFLISIVLDEFIDYQSYGPEGISGVFFEPLTYSLGGCRPIQARLRARSGETGLSPFKSIGDCFFIQLIRVFFHNIYIP